MYRLCSRKKWKQHHIRRCRNTGVSLNSVYSGNTSWSVFRDIVFLDFVRGEQFVQFVMLNVFCEVSSTLVQRPPARSSTFPRGITHFSVENLKYKYENIFSNLQLFFQAYNINYRQLTEVLQSNVYYRNTLWSLCCDLKNIYS